MKLRRGPLPARRHREPDQRTARFGDCLHQLQPLHDQPVPRTTHRRGLRTGAGVATMRHGSNCARGWTLHRRLLKLGAHVMASVHPLVRDQLFPSPSNSPPVVGHCSPRPAGIAMVESQISPSLYALRKQRTQTSCARAPSPHSVRVRSRPPHGGTVSPPDGIINCRATAA